MTTSCSRETPMLWSRLPELSWRRIVCRSVRTVTSRCWTRDGSYVFCIWCRIGAGRPSVSHVLLNDPDPEIRWSSLKCSTGHPDDSIGELLGELAASEPARLRFRT